MRRDLITRTISGTKVTAKVINPATDEITTKEVVLSKVVKDANKVKKLVSKELSENEVLVSITATEQIDKLFGVTVADFMAHAIELDPTTRDTIETVDAE